jgi:hypothetical protein
MVLDQGETLADEKPVGTGPDIFGRKTVSPAREGFRR